MKFPWIILFLYSSLITEDLINYIPKNIDCSLNYFCFCCHESSVPNSLQENM